MKVLFALVIIILTGGLIWFAKLADSPAPASHVQSEPAISRQQILHATDLVAGVKKAVATHDDAAIDQWLGKALELAKVAGLAQQDIAYLQSPAAKNYVVFHAKRSLFNDAFEQAYYAIEDIEPLKTDYPEAQDLFDKADQLVRQRNKLIEQIAQELAQGKAVNDEYLKEAQRQWQQRFLKPTAPSL